MATITPEQLMKQGIIYLLIAQDMFVDAQREYKKTKTQDCHYANVKAALYFLDQAYDQVSEMNEL